MATAIEQVLAQKEMLKSSFKPLLGVQDFRNKLDEEKLQRTEQENAIRNRMALENQYATQRQQAAFQQNSRMAEEAARRSALEGLGKFVATEANLSPEERASALGVIASGDMDIPTISKMYADLGQRSQVNTARQNVLRSTAELEAMGGIVTEPDATVAPRPAQLPQEGIPFAPQEAVQGPVTEGADLRNQALALGDVNQLAALQAGIDPRLRATTANFEQASKEQVALESARRNLSKAEKLLLTNKGIDPATAGVDDIKAVNQELAQNKDLQTLNFLEYERARIKERLQVTPEQEEASFRALISNPEAAGSLGLDEDLADAIEDVQEAMVEARVSSMAELETMFETSDRVAGLDIEDFRKVQAAAIASTGPTQEAVKSTYRSLQEIDSQITKFISENKVGLPIAKPQAFDEANFKDLISNAPLNELKEDLASFTKDDPRYKIIQDRIDELESQAERPSEITDSSSAKAAIKAFKEASSVDEAGEKFTATREDLKKAQEELKQAYEARVFADRDNIVTGLVKRALGNKPSFEVNREIADAILQERGLSRDDVYPGRFLGVEANFPAAVESARLSLGSVLSENPKGFKEANTAKLEDDIRKLRLATQAILNQPK